MASNKPDFIYDKGSETLVGTETVKYKNLATGEVKEVQQISKRTYSQKQFWKVYLADFLQVLGILESKQIDVLIYILSHASPSTNIFIGTYREIAEMSNCSLETTRKVMKKLQVNHFIHKMHNGVYQISPNIMVKGQDRKRAILLEYFYSAPIDRQPAPEGADEEAADEE